MGPGGTPTDAQPGPTSAPEGDLGQPLAARVRIYLEGKKVPRASWIKILSQHNQKPKGEGGQPNKDGIKPNTQTHRDGTGVWHATLHLPNSYSDGDGIPMRGEGQGPDAKAAEEDLFQNIIVQLMAENPHNVRFLAVDWIRPVDEIKEKLAEEIRLTTGRLPPTTLNGPIATVSRASQNPCVDYEPVPPGGDAQREQQQIEIIEAILGPNEPLRAHPRHLKKHHRDVLARLFPKRTLEAWVKEHPQLYTWEEAKEGEKYAGEGYFQRAAGHLTPPPAPGVGHHCIDRPRPPTGGIGATAHTPTTIGGNLDHPHACGQPEGHTKGDGEFRAPALAHGPSCATPTDPGATNLAVPPPHSFSQQQHLPTPTPDTATIVSTVRELLAQRAVGWPVIYTTGPAIHSGEGGGPPTGQPMMDVVVGSPGESTGSVLDRQEGTGLGVQDVVMGEGPGGSTGLALEAVGQGVHLMGTHIDEARLEHDMPTVGHMRLAPPEEIQALGPPTPGCGWVELLGDDRDLRRHKHRRVGEGAMGQETPTTGQANTGFEWLPLVDANGRNTGRWERIKSKPQAAPVVVCADGAMKRLHRNSHHWWLEELAAGETQPPRREPTPPHTQHTTPTPSEVAPPLTHPQAAPTPPTTHPQGAPSQPTPSDTGGHQHPTLSNHLPRPPYQGCLPRPTYQPRHHHLPTYQPHHPPRLQQHTA